MTHAYHLTGPILVGPEDVRDQCWVVEGTVTYDRPPVAELTTINGWVIPGLVDAHCHVGLGVDGELPPEEGERQAVADRDAGALLLRDAGSPADTRWMDDREDLPKIIRAGRHIARPKRYMRNYAHEIEPPALSDMMAQQARRGDGWVKIVGDWIDRDRGDLGTCWPADALADGVAAAHAEGARVTAHCFTAESLPDLVAAGIDCIEHATGLSQDMVADFAERRIAIVPTLVNTANFPDLAAPAREKYPTYYRHMIRLWENRYDTVAAAYEAGVPVFCGTDAAGHVPHGLVAQEVLELTKAGLSHQAALDAAAWRARSWLGRPSLGEGDPADLVVYATDPRIDVRVLADPEAVLLRGKRVVAG